MSKPRRYAFEEYVRASDRWYWNRTKELIAANQKKTTALVAASTAVSVVAFLVAISSRIRKYQ